MSFLLVGENDFTVEGGGLFTFEVYENEIWIEAGDLIGLFAEDGAILPYSVAATECPLRTLYRTAGRRPTAGHVYKFHDVTSDLCRVYSVQAEVEMARLQTTGEWRLSLSLCVCVCHIT